MTNPERALEAQALLDKYIERLKTEQDGKWYTTSLEQAALAAVTEALGRRATETVGWVYEDELPDNYPYEDIFPHSKVIHGVRMFPVFAPLNTAPIVPAGWKLVPIEPTQDMIDLAHGKQGTDQDCIDCYKSMINAAPQPSEDK